MTNGYYISELITSEYGISLILDNHVNRPGYLKPCLEKAMQQAKLPDPLHCALDFAGGVEIDR
jgi:hypothetical protein